MLVLAVIGGGESSPPMRACSGPVDAAAELPGVTTTGTYAAPPATDIHLSAEAAHRLTAFTRIPPAHLTR
ncbi:hypothetical protein K4G64_36355, partial [Streptomyces sp. WAC04114]|nr:hypothetical protein [Streptomyces sp. WAC04114]